MNIRGVERLRRAAQTVANIFVPRAVILVYHRVAELSTDPQLLSVTPTHFAEHLEVLRKFAYPLGLAALVQQIKKKSVPDQTVVITFDDGYADNLYAAKPLLEQYDVPATVFVATNYIGKDCEFWWDELDRVLLQPGRLPNELELRMNGSFTRWNLSEAADYDEDTWKQHRGWTVLDRANPTARHSLFRALHSYLRPLREHERQKCLNDLRAAAGVTVAARPTHRPLSRDELLGLGATGLIEIGAHTVTHPVLAALPEPEQRTEIRESKADLEAILQHVVLTFAYPFGSRSDYTGGTAGIIEESGFIGACSTSPGTVRHGINPFNLPRFLVRDCDGDSFADQLREWLRA